MILADFLARTHLLAYNKAHANNVGSSERVNTEGATRTESQNAMLSNSSPDGEGVYARCNHVYLFLQRFDGEISA